MTAYRRPDSVVEALDLLAEYGDDAKVLAGGQSLLAMMSAGFLRPEVLVDVNRLPDLGAIGVDDETVRVGALVRHHDLEYADERVRAVAPLLPEAAPLIAHAAIRNRGTFVGALVHADPSAEWPAVALTSDARVRLLSRSGERVVDVADFLLGPLTCDIRPDELAVEVAMPAAPPRTGVAVRELAYRDGDYAVVGVAARVSLDGDGGVIDARLTVFAASALPVRIVEAEEALRAGGAGAVGDAARLARERVQPLSDATASAEYRADMVPVFCERALSAAFAHARGGTPVQAR